MQESDISAKVRQSCFSDPFSLQSKQLQPGYVSSYQLLRFDHAIVGKESGQCLTISIYLDGHNHDIAQPSVRPLKR